ncbi:MAG: hypothetical protein QG656_473, partial [Candidatus Hydrogenedentes bacterium]|nr:hypothetical protein [Candidatus Hydrogenedentota bacterium]
APEHAQTADFEDLTGWRVRCFDGAEAKLYRSQQERCFGEYTARVEYSGNTAISRFIVEPSSPIEIPGAITAANLWVRGNNWGFDDPPPTPRVNLRILVQDAKGETYRINIGVVDFDYWSVMHQTFVEPATGTLNKQYVTPEGAADADIDLPAKFIGIEVVGCSGKKPARLHFDALSLYEIQYPPLTFAPIPETLPWPTTPDTILPALTDPPASDSSAPPAIDGDFTWAAKYERDIVRYAYTPKSGTLSDIVAEAGGQVFYPCWKGCVGFEVDGAPMRPDDEGVTVQCKRAAYEDGVVIADWVAWRNEGHPVTYRYTMQLKGKSLIVDVEAEGGMATRLDIGLAKGLNAAKAVYIPYLTYGGDWPRVACSTSNGVNVFLLSLLDYYNSDASELFGAPQIQADDALGYAGGAIYRPKTDAKRNNLRERIFINVSSDVHEVLPSIPNPDCDTGDIARECVWRNVGQLEPEMMAQYKAYGIDKFIACHHEVGWRDAGESFTMRLEAAPRYGDQGLADYGKWMRETLGYRFGTYTNYVDFAPVNSNWNEDDVCLDPDGTWQRAWPRTYAIKPLRAVEKEAYYAPRIHEKFGTNAQYCDVHTAYSPWGRTDYDARTPGAGKFRTQFDSFARLLWNESIAHGGPVFSEGNHHWFYAGIVDGNYATMLPYGEGYRVPPIVDFDLLKMHTKMTDFGMGFGDMFFGMRGSWKEDTSRLSPYYDRFIASTIAFGHIGFLTYEWGFDGTLKSYYQLQALQQRYTMIPVQEIRYFNGEELVDTSTAIATDAYRMQQIYTKYESGLEVWSNLSFGNDWTIVVDGIVYTLPPASFVAFKAGDILEYSATLEGQRHELVQCADYLYLDTRGALVRT